MTERMAIGTQLLDERDIPAGDPGLAGLAGPAGPERPWEEGGPVLPGREGTLLAVVPLPGTGTSLAVVGYVVPAGRPQDTAHPVSAHPVSAHPVAAATPPTQARACDPLIAARPIGMAIDDTQRRLWLDGAEIPLTFQEFELLAFLVAHPATVFSRAELAAQVWRRDFGHDSRTVDVHVSRLRAKMGPVYGRFLVTEYRVGYQYRPPLA